MSIIKIINDRCPLQGECGRKQCEFKLHERDCGYYQGNARPGAEIEDQQQAMEAEWEARMFVPSVLASDPAGSEALGQKSVVIQDGTRSLVMLPVARLHPHPDNPRKDLGDLTELADSIKANGIFQNLTVVPSDSSCETFTVVIGHRRLAAAKLAGLREVPCVVTEMDQKEQLRTMLMENMQRSDLTIYEQAQGFQMMLDMGETVETVAEASGFSTTTVRRRVKLLELDPEKFKKSVSRGATISDYLELDKLEDPALKNEVLDTIGTANFKNSLKAALKREADKKRLLQWETEAREFAVQCEARNMLNGENVPMEYVGSYNTWNSNAQHVERPGDAGTVRYYYCVGSDSVSIYRDPQDVVETEEQIRAREEKRSARPESADGQNHHKTPLSPATGISFEKRQRRGAEEQEYCLPNCRWRPLRRFGRLFPEKHGYPLSVGGSQSQSGGRNGP